MFVPQGPCLTGGPPARKALRAPFLASLGSWSSSPWLLVSLPWSTCLFSVLSLLGVQKPRLSCSQLYPSSLNTSWHLVGAQLVCNLNECL